MQKRMVGFHRDEQNDWVADLECGHTQHVRHKPPWTNRPWVTTREGRDGRLGLSLECTACDLPSTSAESCGQAEPTVSVGRRVLSGS